MGQPAQKANKVKSAHEAPQVTPWPDNAARPALQVLKEPKDLLAPPALPETFSAALLAPPALPVARAPKAFPDKLVFEAQALMATLAQPARPESRALAAPLDRQASKVQPRSVRPAPQENPALPVRKANLEKPVAQAKPRQASQARPVRLVRQAVKVPLE